MQSQYEDNTSRVLFTRNEFETPYAKQSQELPLDDDKMIPLSVDESKTNQVSDLDWTPLRDPTTLLPITVTQAQIDRYRECAFGYHGKSLSGPYLRNMLIISKRTFPTPSLVLSEPGRMLDGSKLPSQPVVAKEPCVVTNASESCVVTNASEPCVVMKRNALRKHSYRTLFLGYLQQWRTDHPLFVYNHKFQKHVNRVCYQIAIEKNKTKVIGITCRNDTRCQLVLRYADDYGLLADRLETQHEKSVMIVSHPRNIRVLKGSKAALL